MTEFQEEVKRNNSNEINDLAVGAPKPLIYNKFS